MKNSLLFLILFFGQMANCQKWTETQTPLFSRLDSTLINETLKDFVRDGRERIYYKFIVDSIEHEFFKLPNSRYKYRQGKLTGIEKEGYFLFRTVETDTSTFYPAGQYEEEVLIRHFGELIIDGFWHITTNEGWMNGNYTKGKKSGEWTIYRANSMWSDRTEIAYRNDTIISIMNPDSLVLEESIPWILSNTFYVCEDETKEQQIFGKDDLIFYLDKSKLECLKSYKTIKLTGTSEIFIDEKKLGSWSIFESGLEIQVQDTTYKYSIGYASNYSMSLKRVEL